jgi:hypothetical protein
MDLENPLDVYQVGIGAELWINMILGYGGFADFRFGIARGLDSSAPPGNQTYLVLSSGF